MIGLRSELSSTTIQNRIRVGNYIAKCTEANTSILLFRSNKISHTKFLEEITRKQKKRKLNRKNKFDYFANLFIDQKVIDF